MKKTLSILLVAALLATLCACGRKDEDHPITQKELEEVLIGDTEDTENTEDTEPARFWLNTHTGSKKPFTGTLFGGQTVPVDLEGDFDADNGPYCWGPNGVFTGQTYDHLADILNSDDALESYWEETAGTIAGDIMTRTRFDEEKHEYIRDSTKPDCVWHIYLLNLSREEADPLTAEDEVWEYQEKPAADCYAQNWWYIQGSSDALDLGMETSTDTHSDEAKMEALWDRLGAPNYLAAKETGPVRAVLDADSGELEYELVYEYDGFVLSVSVQESIVTGNKQVHTLHLTGVRYYTPESWAEVQTELELLDYAGLNLMEETP